MDSTPADTTYISLSLSLSPPPPHTHTHTPRQVKWRNSQIKLTFVGITSRNSNGCNVAKTNPWNRSGAVRLEVGGGSVVGAVMGAYNARMHSSRWSRAAAHAKSRSDLGWSLECKRKNENKRKSGSVPTTSGSPGLHQFLFPSCYVQFSRRRTGREKQAVFICLPREETAGAEQ